VAHCGVDSAPGVDAETIHVVLNERRNRKTAFDGVDLAPRQRPRVRINGTAHVPCRAPGRNAGRLVGLRNTIEYMFPSAPTVNDPPTGTWGINLTGG
jgi:hypothetical protein